MGKGRYLPAIPKQLTPEDKEYIKLIADGVKPSPAFREAYPQHETVIFWKLAERGTPEHQKARTLLATAAKNKLQSKYIRRALMTYQDKMEEFSILSLETATELVQTARSEKVRADLAVEGIRHKIGTPVQKVAVQEHKTVVLTFDSPPPGDTILEGETV